MAATVSGNCPLSIRYSRIAAWLRGMIREKGDD
jgi:hypothetical protein